MRLFFWILLYFSVFISAAQNSTTKAFLFEDYQDGVIVNHKGGRVPVKLNYSTLEEKLYIKKGDHQMALEYQLNIDTVFFGLRPFIYADEYFMELIVDAPISLYLRHQSKLVDKGTSIGYGTRTQTGSADSFRFAPSERKDVPAGKEIQEVREFYIRYHDEVLELKKWSNIYRLVPSLKPVVKKYIREQNPSISRDSFKVILFCNQVLQGG
jgi:hypothetical protein